MSTFDRYKEQYAVNFKSGGDLTKDAFWKHIQEIHRIYGILNDLDANSVDSATVTKAIDDAINKLKSTWKPSLTFNDISGTLDGSRLSGNISAALIKGALTNATIPSGNVTGLEGFVNGKISAIPTPPDKGDGIKAISKYQRGYVQFNNGFIIQWGVANRTSYGGCRETFPITFPNQCLMVTGCSCCNDGKTSGQMYGDDGDSVFMVNAWDRAGFGFASDIEDNGVPEQKACYIAIGY